MAECFSILDDLLIFRVGQLPIHFHLLLGCACFRDALEEVVALSNQTCLGQLQIFGDKLSRFPEWLVFRYLRIETLIGTRRFNHGS